MRAWVMAIRPPTLAASAVPVIVGSAVAHKLGGFNPSIAGLALLGALLIQVGTNFANDVFDFEKGADTHERLGPTRVVQAGLLSARAVRIAMVFVFGAAVGVGALLAWRCGLWVVWVGIASILSGLAYTGGPFPLAYHGLGDIFVFVFFGLVAVLGTIYAQVPTIEMFGLSSAVAVGALSTAILVVNNLRDIATDIPAGKRTLATRFGERFAERQYVFVLVLAYGAVAVAALISNTPPLALVFVTLPMAARLVYEVHKLRGKPLNNTLRHTAQLLLRFGVLLALGLII